MHLVLASASPRRADLLRTAGFVFDVDPAHTDESVLPGESAAVYVARVARDKAIAVRTRHTGAAVIGADTIVVLDEQILGKPSDRGEAVRMLTRMSGRMHDVLTGISVLYGRHALSAIEISHVRMTAMTPEDIRWYVNSGEPDDKAGAYGVQGLASRFIEGIDGSYSNVMGLPVACVYRLLRELGFVDGTAAAARD